MASISEEELYTILSRNPNLLKRNSSKLYGLKPQNTTHQDATADKPKRGSKYRNEKVYVYSEDFVSYGKKDDRFGKPIAVFDSRKEHARWNELKLMERAGKISDLKRQVPLVIQEEFQYKDEKIQPIVYKADFMYVKNDQSFVEDVKGQDKKTGKYITTKEFNLKWKLLKARYPQYSFTLI